MKYLVLSLVFGSVFLNGYPLIPNGGMTIGSLCETQDFDFTEYRYAEKIPYCHRNVSTELKTEIYDAYEIPREERTHYTIDHFIPLSLGGTNHRDNLWPEHKEVKALRPALEMQLFVAIRDGKITQQRAIEIIRDRKLHPCDKVTGETFPGEEAAIISRTACSPLLASWEID